MAFESRLISARASKSRSPITQASCSSPSTVMVIFLVDASDHASSAASRITSCNSSSAKSCARARSAFASRRKSSARFNVRREYLPMRSTSFSTGIDPGSSRCISSSVRIEACGERMSCERKRKASSRRRSDSRSGDTSTSVTIEPVRTPRAENDGAMCTKNSRLAGPVASSETDLV